MTTERDRPTYQRIQLALESLVTQRDEFRLRLDKLKGPTIPLCNPRLRANRELSIQSTERRISDLTAIIEFTERQLDVLLARGEPNVVRNFAAVFEGNIQHLTAEQAADLAFAERECVEIVDWYQRRHASGNMPEPHFTRGTRGVRAIRRSLDILRALPVAASKSPGQKAFEARQAQYESGSRGTCTPVTWAEQSARTKEEWEAVAKAVTG